MNLQLSDEHLALREVARDFLAEAAPVERLATTADALPSADLWGSVAKLGWLGVSVPVEHGGAGLDLLAETILFEEYGHALLSDPLYSTLALALPVFLAGDLPAEPVERIVEGRLTATFAWGEPGRDCALSALGAPATRAERVDESWRLEGHQQWVPHAAQVDVLVVPATGPDGPALFSVPRGDPGVDVCALDTLDATRPLAEVRLAHAPARRLVPPSRAHDVRRDLWRRALVLAAAEAVGIARRAVSMSRDYASQRQQFGRPIGTYQAVSHKLADAYVSLELSRSLVMWAALAVDAQAPAADVAVASAAAKALRTATSACERTIQIHGGVGMTWESPLHRFYKRALYLSTLDGPPSRQRARVLTALRNPPEDGPRSGAGPRAMQEEDT